MGADLIPVLVDDPLQMAWLDRNDLGNAERMVRLSRGLLLWVDGIGWVAYDGRRWSARDGDRQARRLAHDVARHIDREAAALDGIANDPKALEDAFGWAVPTDLAEERVIALRKHAVASGDASRTNAMLTQAKELLQLRADRDEFDQDPLAINLANGTLRFVARAGGGWEARLDPHEPTDRFMQLAPVHYDKDAECPDWIERMKLVQPDRDQRGLLQQIYGYCLTGLTSEQKFFIYQGRGGDGKSATNMVVSEMFGDYARHADVKTFLKGATKSGSDHSSDLARLAGDVRFVLCEEPDRNATWDGGLLKKVTGGKVTARPLREAEIEYYPHWKLIVEVNPLPAVPSDDDGFWRRCWVVPWPFQFKASGTVQPEAMDIVVSRLLEQASGILNWMVAGACKWLETRRLPASGAAKEAIDSYRQSASPMGEWLGDRCDLTDRDALTKSGALYADFKEWCEKAGIEKIPTQTAFGRALRDRQVLEKKDGAGNRFRRGIRLKPDGIGGDLGARASGPADPAYDDRGVGGRDGARSAPAIFDEDDFDPEIPA
jgi:putative DNA primase/helicase